MKYHNKQFQCERCSRQFSHKYMLMHHAERDHGVCGSPRSHSCPDCDECFAFKRSLRIHSRTHDSSPAKPYKCSNCGRCFAQGDTLKAHICLFTVV